MRVKLSLHSKLQSEGFLVGGVYSSREFSEYLASFSVKHSSENYGEVYICSLKRALSGEYSVEGDFQIIYYKPQKGIARVGENFLSEAKRQNQTSPKIRSNSTKDLVSILNINGRLQFMS